MKLFRFLPSHKEDSGRIHPVRRIERWVAGAAASILDTVARTGTADGGDKQYVTLEQMAGLLNLQKKTLERWYLEGIKKGKLPEPDVEGGGGKPHEWLWSRVRKPLEKTVGEKDAQTFSVDPSKMIPRSVLQCRLADRHSPASTDMASNLARSRV